MRLVNMMPEDLKIFGKRSLREGPLATIPASGKLAGMHVTELGSDQAEFGVLFERVQYGQSRNIPRPSKGTMYIVPLIVALADRERMDLLSPYDAVLDNNNQIAGYRKLQRVV